MADTGNTGSSVSKTGKVGTAGGSAGAGTGDRPRDALVIENILSSMGVQEYDPRVVNQLLEFTYRYIGDVFTDAASYSEHAMKPSIDIDDVRLAIQSRVNYSFTQPPLREFLLELAKTQNSKPLPLISDAVGVRLPPEQYTLVEPNYQLRPAGSTDGGNGGGGGDNSNAGDAMDTS